MTGTDEFGASSVGVAIGRASTMGSRESGAVCRTVPLCPSLIPLCVSRITGLRLLLDAANTLDAALTVANEIATTARTGLSERIGDMGGPVRVGKAGLRGRRPTLPRHAPAG
jgi:hypothetical protein